MESDQHAIEAMFPDEQTLTEYGRAAWAGMLVESCLRKACRNLAQVDLSAMKAQWLKASRGVLATSADRQAVETIRTWLDRVEAALKDRDRMLHADRRELMWANPGGEPVPGGVGLLNRARDGTQHVTHANPGALRVITNRLLESIHGWERVHQLAIEVAGRRPPAGRTTP